MASKMKLVGAPKGSRDQTRIQYDPQQIKKAACQKGDKTRGGGAERKNVQL